MKKLLIFITLSLFNFSISFAEGYSNLKSFNDFIYGKNQLDIKCFDAEGFAYINHDRIDFDKKVVFVANYKLSFDKSSSKSRVNYFTNLFESYSFYSLDLETLNLEAKYINGKVSKDQNIKKKIKSKKDAFKIFDIVEPTSIKNFKCAQYWKYKLEDFGEEIYQSLLNEGAKFSNQPKCKGVGKLGPDDPSINWNNCVGIKKGGDSDYIGEFVDGFYHGQGIMFTKFGEIYVGNFKEDNLHGSILVFAQVDTMNQSVSDPTSRKSWIVKAQFIDGEISDTNQPEWKELKTK
jgi:hypothetical protein